MRRVWPSLDGSSPSSSVVPSSSATTQQAGRRLPHDDEARRAPHALRGGGRDTRAGGGGRGVSTSGRERSTSQQRRPRSTSAGGGRAAAKAIHRKLKEARGTDDVLSVVAKVRFAALSLILLASPVSPFRRVWESGFWAPRTGPFLMRVYTPTALDQSVFHQSPKTTPTCRRQTRASMLCCTSAGVWLSNTRVRRSSSNGDPLHPKTLYGSFEGGRQPTFPVRFASLEQGAWEPCLTTTVTLQPPPHVNIPSVCGAGGAPGRRRDHHSASAAGP